MKFERQSKILSLIKANAIETQSELARILCENGMDVTQATVSRDIRELKLVKILDRETGLYKYSQQEESSSYDLRIVNIFKEAVVSIDTASIFICIHTLTGMANAAAVAIDSMKNKDIIGCVAGDDTIFVMVRREEQAIALADLFRRILTETDSTPLLKG
ncbi:MAG: arginine repressor [Eubacteriaceae bacterium]|jgi:transcriptional regulator of arginine metabolism|nr:arginine repressor [Eubacteriaceae bacterium]